MSTATVHIPVVFAVGNRKLLVAILAEVSLKPVGFTADLIQDSKQQLFRCHGSTEDADSLPIGTARVSSCPD